jgi:hypothetical protein
LSTRQFLDGLHWGRRGTTRWRGGNPSLGFENREARRGEDSTGKPLNFMHDHIPKGDMTFG